MKNQVHRKFSPTRVERELDRLRQLSARVGSNPLLVQASNGNTSIKREGILWIKGSGKWLARANQEEILIPIELAEAKETVEQGGEIAPRQISANRMMRPSIETAMHAVLPHRVVIHVHSINTIAWAIRSDGIEELTARLRGLRWQWIPYAPSGIPLAREIELAVARAKETDVFILANHGLVVCGQDCAASEELLCEVERRLAISARPFPMPDSAVLGNIARFSGWQISRLRFFARARHRQSGTENSKGWRVVSVPGYFSGPRGTNIAIHVCRVEIESSFDKRRTSLICGGRKKRGNAAREDDQRRARHFDRFDGSGAPNRGIRTTALLDQRGSREGGQRRRARIQKRGGDGAKGKFCDRGGRHSPGTGS